MPAGWTEQPLTNAVGPGRSASFTDPASSDRIDLEVIGGEFSEAYGANNKPNSSGALSLGAGGVCPNVRGVILSASSIAFGCDVPAGESNGVVIVEPYPGGWKSLVTTLTKAQHPLATEILNSFHP